MKGDVTTARAGDLILVHEAGLDALLIQKATGGRWNHVAVVADGRLIEALDSGVAKSDLHKYDGKDAALVAVPLTDAQRATALGFLAAQVGDPYDYDMVAEFAMNLLTKGRFVFGEDGHYFCAELAAAMLKSAGYPVPVDPRRISPNDLARLFGVPTEG